MKRNLKKAIGLLMVMALLLTGVVVVTEKSSEAASGTYWLTGGYDYSTLKYTGSKFKLSGKWGKGKSMDGSVNKYYSSPKTLRKTLKKASGFKTGGYDEGGLYYDDTPQVSAQFITCSIKVKNGKVACIIYSAM